MNGCFIKTSLNVEYLSIIDLAAKTAIQHDIQLRSYYLERIEKGKPTMSTINVVRNKLLYRMFAVVKRQTPFVKEYFEAA